MAAKDIWCRGHQQIIRGTDQDLWEGIHKELFVYFREILQSVSRDFPITDWKIGVSDLDTLLSATGCH